MSIGRHIAAGAVAGAVGTAALDMVWYRRYRRGGGKDGLARWESAEGVMSWDEASAPGQLGRKVLRLLLRREPPHEWARTTTNVMHWATGVGWGVQYGLLASRTSRYPWLRALALGPVAWGASYVILPLAKVYKPIWQYDGKTLAEDLSAHMAFGAGTSAAYGVLARSR